MKITANGKEFEVTEGETLPDFIKQIGLMPDKVVVERNSAALTPDEAGAVVLEAGDRLEIVRIVAGG